MSDAHSTADGRIEVICGCMFAGKTATLISRLSAAHANGQNVLAFKHAIDTRYDKARLATHDGRTFDALLVPDAAAILDRAAGVHVIGIDEAQFFGRGLIRVVLALRAAGLRVILAGIHNDAWGRPFPPFPQLREIADTLDTLSAPCTRCAAPAEFSQRMVPVTDEFMIGGVADYQPRCAACFEPLPQPAPPY